jgi:hypothetical protein
MIDYGDLLTRVFVETGRGYNNNYFGYLENIPNDYALVQLSRTLGVGLKKAKAKKQDYNNLTYSGFKYDRYKLDFKTEYGSVVDLYSLYAWSDKYYRFQIQKHDFSIEEFNKLSLLEKLKFIGMSENFAKEQIQKHPESVILENIKLHIEYYHRIQRDYDIIDNPQILITTHKVLPGQSGGPITNSLGEYLGLITNGIFTNNPKNQTVKPYGAAGYLFK